MSTDANSQKHSAQPSEEFLVLAETIADIKSRFERVESEFSTQAKPLEAAGIALNAAVAGLKALQVHVLDQNVANLALKLETTKTAIDEQIGVVVAELKKADDAAIAKTDEAAKALRAELSQIGEQIGKLTTQFGAEIARVSLEAKQHAEKFAAIPGARGADGKAINPTGSYAADKAYSRLDLVSYMGGSYVSNVDGNTEKPGPKAKNWTQVASRGGGGAGTDFTSISGTCLATQGGTGQTSYAVGDLLYADATTTLAKLTAGASGKYLKSNGAGAAPSWETVSAGDASGPSSATDNAFARFDGTTGKLLQNSAAFATDDGDVGVGTATPLYKFHVVGSYMALGKGVGNGSNQLLFGVTDDIGLIQVTKYAASNDNVLQINPYGGRVLFGTQTDDGVNKLQVNGSISTQGGTASTPATAGAAGVAGTIKWDADYIYVCVATNTWKRAAIATW